MHFPIADITVNPILPIFLGFVVAALCSSCGVSGVFLLVPAEMSLWDFVSPAVSPTSQIYNIVGLPGAIIRYVRDQRMNWPLLWVLLVGVLPGMFVGALIRVRYLTNPGDFKAFIGIVLLYPGLRLLNQGFNILKKRQKITVAESAQSLAGQGDSAAAAVQKSRGETAAAREDAQAQPADKKGKIVLPKEAIITGGSLSWKEIKFDFWGQSYTVSTMAVGIMAAVVGVVSGIYGIGGAVFTSTFLVSFIGLPVYVTAGATLAGAFAGSVFGVIFYSLIAMTPLGAGHHVAPDLLLGLLLGVGGFCGNYVGAWMQKYLPERAARAIMGVLVSGLAVAYVGHFILASAGSGLHGALALF